MMSSMFEIPILYVACDVKIVKERVSFFCSRVLRKIQLQKKLPCSVSYTHLTLPTSVMV